MLVHGVSQLLAQALITLFCNGTPLHQSPSQCITFDFALTEACNRDAPFLLKGTFGNEVRVYNNLGIIQKRNGDSEGALASYEKALKVDRASFFPNYNLGVLLSQEKMQPAEALVYFNRALSQAHKAQEQLYEINVLINIALIHES